MTAPALLPGTTLDRRLPGDGATTQPTNPQCMKCGGRSPWSHMDKPVRGSELRRHAPGFGCRAGDRPPIDPDAAVLSVLRDAGKPIQPAEVARRLASCYGMTLRRDAMARALHRVAVQVSRGWYRAPAEVTP